MNIFKSSSWDRIWIQKFCAVGVNVGLVELKYRFNVGGMEGKGGWVGCTQKISLILCLEVPEKFMWVVGGGGGG